MRRVISRALAPRAHRCALPPILPRAYAAVRAHAVRALHAPGCLRSFCWRRRILQRRTACGDRRMRKAWARPHIVRSSSAACRLFASASGAARPSACATFLSCIRDILTAIAITSSRASPAFLRLKHWRARQRGGNNVAFGGGRHSSSQLVRRVNGRCARLL